MRALTIVVLLSALTPTGQARVPPTSRERAERFEQWRERLDAAERARAERDWTEAEGHYRAVVDEADEADRRSLPYARAVEGLGDLRRLAGRLEEARELYERSASLWESLLGPRQPRLAVTLHHLGLVQMQLGDCAAARGSLERALAVWEASLGRTSNEAEGTRRTLRNLDAACADPL